MTKPIKKNIRKLRKKENWKYQETFKSDAIKQAEKNGKKYEKKKRENFLISNSAGEI